MNIFGLTRFGYMQRWRRCAFNNNALVSKLEQINQRDASIVLTEKKKRIDKEISSEVAACITTNELANDILSIHTFYGNERNKRNDKLSIEDTMKMRSYIGTILKYYDDIPEPAMQYIENILKKHNALD